MVENKVVSLLWGFFKLRSFLAFGALVLTANASAQVDPAPERARLEALYAELDSLFDNEAIPADLFYLADSLLSLEKIKFSSLNARTAYISQIQSAGRNFGVEQFGFNNGVTYMYKSGLYADVSSFIHSEYRPRYFLTTASVGYMNTIKNKWLVNFSYDQFIYNDTLDFRPFSGALQMSQFYEFKKLDVGFDYSYLMGRENAHRIGFHINGRFRWRDVGFFDRITLLPGASLLFGNSNVFFWRQSETPFKDLFEVISSEDLPRLSTQAMRRLGFLLATDRDNAATFLLNRNGYSQAQINQFFNAYDMKQLQITNEFGLMNYSFNFPVILTKGNFSLLLNYTYNIPVALPNEEFEYPASGFFSASLSYTLIWKK